MRYAWTWGVAREWENSTEGISYKNKFHGEGTTKVGNFLVSVLIYCDCATFHGSLIECPYPTVVSLYRASVAESIALARLVRFLPGTYSS